MNGDQNARATYVLLAWVLPVFVASVLLPSLLIGVFVMTGTGTDLGPHSAVEQGELYLAAGNAAVAGVALLLAARHQIDGMLLALSVIVLILVVTPSYALWALIAARSLSGETYSISVATKGRALALTISVSLSLLFAFRSYDLGQPSPPIPPAVATTSRPSLEYSL